MYIGLDLGTTNIKALAVDELGKIHDVGSCPVEIYYLSDGGVEQDIENIWQGVLKILKEIASKIDSKKIKAIGVSSQGGALQILDSNSKPVGRVISWLDSRAAKYNNQLTQKLGSSWFGNHVGHLQSNLTIGQILRLKDQNKLPANYKIGYVGDLIVQRLCGIRAHDHTSLSIALLYNPYRQEPCSEILKELDVSESQLPVLLSPFQKAGCLLQDIAEQTGLPQNTVVSPAIHDQYAAALGCGVLNEGDMMLGTGTAWVILTVSNQRMHPITGTSLVCRHIVNNLYGQIISMINGGSCLAWLLKLLNIKDVNIDEICKKVTPDISNPIFIPHLAGSNADGKIFQMKLSHTQDHFVRAAIEGLGFELRCHIERTIKSGTTVSRLVMTGKAAQSTITPQILANIIQRPIVAITEPNVSAFGASIAARKIFDNSFDFAKNVLSRKKTYLPDEHCAVYERLFEKYLQFVNIQD